jgi:hypothetical protein
MYALIEDVAYHFETECSACGTKDRSETLIRKCIPGAATPELAREEKEFSKCLEARGWNLKPVLCKECCDELVIERVGEAFKGALTAKGGEGK